MKIKPENRFWIGIYGFTAFIMLVAMSVFGWLAWTSRGEPGIGTVAGPRPVNLTTSPLPDEEYETLAAFKPPGYTYQPRAPKAFQAAMALYEKSDYPSAAAALRAVSNAQPDLEAARFYLGISLLLSGNRISGIQELSALTDDGKTSYVDRARFYLAKGLIAEHDLKRAQEQLRLLVDGHGDFEKEAAALLAKIQTSQEN